MTAWTADIVELVIIITAVLLGLAGQQFLEDAIRGRKMRIEENRARKQAGALTPSSPQSSPPPGRKENTRP